MNNSGFNRVEWPEHFSNGGTGITVTTNPEQHRRALAIFDPEGKKLCLKNNDTELHFVAGLFDMGEYYRLFASLPKGATGKADA